MLNAALLSTEQTGLEHIEERAIVTLQSAAASSCLAIMLAFGPGPAGSQTQDEVMEYQSCVMRCSANASGADDPAYATCIRDVCDGGLLTESEAGAADAPEASGRVWSFSAHPVIGSSAHIDVGTGGIGYSCGVDSNTVALLIDNTLFRSDSMVVIVDDWASAFTVERQAGALSRHQDAGCYVGLPEVAAGSTLYLARGKIEAINSVGTNTFTISQDGQLIEVRAGENIVDRLGAVALPLRGSSRAIESLLRGCPIVRADVADYCGAE